MINTFLQVGSAADSKAGLQERINVALGLANNDGFRLVSAISRHDGSILLFFEKEK